MEAREILKIATVENISVKDARLRFDSLYSSRTKRHLNMVPAIPNDREICPPPSEAQSLTELETLKAEVASIQMSLKTFGEVTLPSIQANIREFIKLTNREFSSQ